MTRVNIHMKPILLSDSHLLAEHREIIRLFKLGKDYWARDPKKRSTIPADFKLGKGHVNFFYDKLDWVADRYLALYAECIERGFNVTDMSDALDNLPAESVGNYNPDARTMDRTRMLLMLRISKRLSLSLQQPRYMSEPVDAANLVNAMSLDIFGKHITLDTADLSDEDKASV